MSGRKDDTDKLRYDLIPAYPLERLAEVYTIGAKKYAARNWEKGLSYGRVFSAMMRHSWAWWRGETYDPVDGQHHLSSVAWCAFALMEYQEKKTGEDDRPNLSNANYVIEPAQATFEAGADPREAELNGAQDAAMVQRIEREGRPGRRADFDVVTFQPCEDCHSMLCWHTGTCSLDLMKRYTGS